MKTFEWQYENDGYGIVGISFSCPYCGHENRFVSPDPDEMECDKCHALSAPETVPGDY